MEGSSDTGDVDAIPTEGGKTPLRRGGHAAPALGEPQAQSAAHDRGWGRGRAVHRRPGLDAHDAGLAREGRLSCGSFKITDGGIDDVIAFLLALIEERFLRDAAQAGA